MEGRENGDSTGRQGRWTCEACGCHTNTDESLSCSICGTRRVPSLLRRAGHATTSRLFSRSLAARRAAGLEENFNMDDSVDLDSDEIAGDDEEQAVALALEVSGVTGPSSRVANAQASLSRRLRSMGAASAAFSGLCEGDPRPSSDEVLLAATENASLYQPKWMNSSQLGGRNRGGNGIVLDTGGNQSVAHLALGAGEGKAVRAAEPFPRGALPSSGPSSAGSTDPERRRRRAFGFKVAFDHPRREAGSNMGGCYLVGVTTSSFHAFGERNGLQQSRFFWGIEDGGSKFEGPRNSNSPRGTGRGGSSNYGIEIGRGEAPRNSDNVLFGSREVVSVVVDLEMRRMTFWRDDRLLGTLVSNLPRSGNIYPIVVPFNAGVSVAITGMDSSPLPLLQNFVSHFKRSQKEKEELQRKTLIQRRSLLIQNGKLTQELRVVLKTIFSLYRRDGQAHLDVVSASRLWYRCGMKLSSLEPLAEKNALASTVKGYSPLFITVDDFLGLIEKIVEEDEISSFQGSQSDSTNGSQVTSNFGASADLTPGSVCKVGDVVELVNGHERYGDAASGPLSYGDRGLVVEVQQGSKGERNSVRVLYNGRRWWYQPQALKTERSGLIETPAVWFLRTVLRSHGYDHKTLQPLWGSPVTTSSWEVGDLVAPHKPKAKKESPSRAKTDSTSVGRIVSDSSTPNASPAARGMVLVEYVDPSFGVAIGSLTGAVPEASSEIQRKRVRLNRLVHASCSHHLSSSEEHDEGEELDGVSSAERFVDAADCSDEDEGVRAETTSITERGEGASRSFSFGMKLKAEIAGVARLQLSSIKAIKKECEKGPAALAGIFASGLPDAVFSSLQHAKLEVVASKNKTDISPALVQLCKLVILIAKQLFPSHDHESYMPSGCTSSTVVSSSTGMLENLQQSRSESPTPPELPHFAFRDHDVASQLFGEHESLENSVPRHFPHMGVRELLRGLNNAGNVSSAQHRRSVLLALMSGSRTNDNLSPPRGWTMDMGLDVPVNSDPLSVPLGQFRGGGMPPAYIFGQQNSLSRGSWNELARLAGYPEYQGHLREMDGGANRDPLSDQNMPSFYGSSRASLGTSRNSLPIIESVLRGRGVYAGNKVPGKGTGCAVSAQTKSFVLNGVLPNNLKWVNAIIDSQTKRASSKMLRGSPHSLTQSSDDEGVPLLLLAVSLGCSMSVLGALINSGANVGEKEIRRAALTNQPKALSFLLRHAVYSDGSIDLKTCSDDVADVLRAARARQLVQEENMRKDGSSFVSAFVTKLLCLGLVCSRQRCRKSMLCGRAVSEALAGNVLLHAMHRSQSEALLAGRRAKKVGSASQEESGSENGRVPLFGANRKENSTDNADAQPSQISLLEVLPADLLCETFATNKSNLSEGSLIAFLLLVEAHLWSRTIEEVAVGLTLLLTVLRKIPVLGCSPVFERYGFRELVVSHEGFAKNALDEIHAHQLSFCPGQHTQSLCSQSASEVDEVSLAAMGVVLCPKKHVAELHLTRHSSFRCDLCGKGVERGMPMHGCRECDWDACERCTDKAEGGMVKWRRILDLTAECRKVLSVTSRVTFEEETEGTQGRRLLDTLRAHESAVELGKLERGLHQRDFVAVEELAALLDTPGRITMHEFSSSVLPTIHSALVGKPADRQLDMGNARLGLGIAGSRRHKKPRVGRSFCETEDSSEILSYVVSANAERMDRVLFCNKSVKDLVLFPQSRIRKESSPVSSRKDERPTFADKAENDSTIPLFRMSSGDEEGESDDDSTEHRRDEPPGAGKSTICPEFLRRVNDVLAFNQRVAILNSDSSRQRISGGTRSEAGDLQSLTLPIEIELVSSEAGGTAYRQNADERRPSVSSASIVFAEPLMPMAELQLHILRTRPINHPSYKRFCRRLALEHAIIAERPSSSSWMKDEQNREVPGRRLAQIVSYDETVGAHLVRYASGAKSNVNAKMIDAQCVRDHIDFDGDEACLVLAARDYFILHRARRGGTAEMLDPFDMETELLLSDADVLLADGIDTEFMYSSPGILPTVENETEASPQPPSLGAGMRVESTCGSPEESWLAYTIISVESECANDRHLGNQIRYVLVSDEGEVFRGVEADEIRGCDTRLTQRRTYRGRDRIVRNSFSPGSHGELNRSNGGDRSFPFFGVRRSATEATHNDAGISEQVHTPRIGVLKRTWSALSPLEDMSPLELNVSLAKNAKAVDEKRLAEGGRALTCSVAGSEIEVLIDHPILDTPPGLRVDFSAQRRLSTLDMDSLDETTVFCGLRRLFDREEATRMNKLPSGGKCKLFYSVTIDDCARKLKGWYRPFEKDDAVSTEVDCSSSPWSLTAERSRKLENDEFGLCEGIDEACLQCMEILSVLAEALEGHDSHHKSEDQEAHGERENLFEENNPDAIKSCFESETLTTKLLEQLEDPLTVVGGALPEWCTAAPTFAPHIFSYEARRLLLERAAFGVSRSALKQQEAKVAVGPLRQRMAALRGRAVELVGEAFSGGAEDPTALQLQADELYGMEEALAARVNAAFRAQRWDERSLQCAKAAVRRGMLLSDAAAVMERYANDARVRRRRLEVRFEGESGFDASLDEAGVTRGFYSDIAEQLLSCDHVSGVYCKAVCAAVGNHFAQIDPCVPSEFSLGHSKLPLWIPDMDASGQVVIPTPRADPRSGLGVYPRPLSPHHPQFKAVLKQYRFMGRLFAAALRDGFVFPLPLSTGFLKLVQNGNDSAYQSAPMPATAASFNAAARLSSHNMNAGHVVSNISSPALNRNPSIEEMSVSDASASGNVSFFSGPNKYAGFLPSKRTVASDLNSSDLPRPGFLGGDVYAVEVHICAALDKLEASDPPISRGEYEKRCKEIASDKSFARRALGKLYDCSFEEYFEDKFFVDPFDPGSDCAIPLCPTGHTRSVTIYNVREWVTLAKDFILRDGVMGQALAFRQGVDDFFSADYLRLFTADELQRDVCGGGDNVDKWEEDDVRKLFKLDGGRGAAEALVAVAAMGGEGGAALSRRFGPASPTVGYLVKALLEASPTKRRQFLSFVTSVPIVTPGQIEVVPVVNPSGEFLPMRDPGCLPRANTCARRLYLPKFESYDSFTQVLWAVVREESKFKGFYEWRG